MSAIDSSALSCLKSVLESARANTDKMVSKLQRFEDRLLIVDAKMRPIQDTTNTYSNAKMNIAETIAEVEKTYEYFRITIDVDGIINHGYGNHPHTDFFSAMEKLSRAKQFFEAHRRDIKSSNSALINIENLLHRAEFKLADDLERLLSSGKSSFTFITDEHKNAAINPYSTAIIDEIKTVISAFQANGFDIYYHVYQKVRIDRVKIDLSTHEQEHSDNWAKLLDDVPYQKGTHPLESYYNLACEIVRGELLIWGSILPQSDDSLAVLITISDFIIKELQRLISPTLLVEFDLNSSNVILKQSNSFLIRMDMLDIFAMNYEDLRDLCRPDLSNESSASERVTMLRNILVEGCIESINNLLNTSLSHGLVEHDQQGIFDDSCDLIPLTGNVLYCCKELSGFASVYSRIHDFAKQLGIDFPASVPTLPELILELIKNLLENIRLRSDKFDKFDKKGANAIDKRRTINLKKHHLYDVGDKEATEIISVSRKYLFIVNNMFAVYMFLREKKKEIIGAGKNEANKKRTSSAGTLIASLSGPKTGINDIDLLEKLIGKVEGILSQSQIHFCESVAKSVALTNIDMNEFADLYQKEKVDKGRLLKAKFAALNSGIDALLLQQGEWRIPAQGLRDLLTNKLLDTLMPVYQDFFSTYSIIPFSKKHMAQYLRYPPHEVEQVIKSFFSTKKELL